MSTRAFDLSVVYPQAFPLSTPDTILDDLSYIHSLGAFTGVELTHIEDVGTRNEVAKCLRDMEFRVVFLAGLPSFKAKAFLNAQGEARTRAINYTKSLIQEAADLGADALLVVSGPDCLPSEREESLLRLIQSLQEICSFSRTNFPEIEIRLEHTDREMHRKQLIGPTTESIRIIKELESSGESLRLNLDLSHILQLGEEVGETLAKSRSHCNHFHFSNCVIKDSSHPLFGDYHPQFEYAESEVGREELKKTWQLLDTLGYLDQENDTVLGIEVVPLPEENPRTTLRDALSFIQATQSAAFS